MNNFSTVGWFMSRIYSIAPALFILLMLSAVVTSVIPPIELYIVKKIIDVIQPLAGTGEWLDRSVMVHLAVLLFITITLCLFQSIKSISISKLWALEGLRGDIVSKSTRIQLDAFETPYLNDLMQNVNNGIGYRTRSITESVVTCIFTIISISSFAILLADFIIWIPILVLIFAIPQLVIHIRQSEETYDLSKSLIQQEREAQYYLRLMTERESVKEVKLFSIHDFLLSSWAKIVLNIRKLRNKLLLKQQKKVFGLKMMSLLSITSSFAMGMFYFYKGNLAISGLIILIQGVFFYEKYLSDLGKNLADLKGQLLYANDLRKFLEFSEDPVEGTVPKEEKYTIRFENVSFKYPNSSHYVYEKLNFEIQKGEKIALIGVNGAGKTTLIKLLLGIFKPTTGRIYINSVDLNYMDLHMWRRKMGVVFQDFIKFQFTLRENIGFGDVSLMHNEQRIVEAAANAYLSDLADNLPNFYGTKLGKYFDDGVDLSGGQWQRVAIARAYFRDFSFLIFDEPTSALDPKSELEMFNTFTDLSSNKGAIFISHRLSTTRFADRIFLINEGKLAEQGTLEQLLDMDGEFAKMFVAQANLYGREQEVS